MTNFSEILKIRMDTAQLSNAELARITGLNRSLITRYKKGKLLPREKIFEKLNSVLQFTELEKIDYKYQRDKAIQIRMAKRWNKPIEEIDVSHHRND